MVPLPAKHPRCTDRGDGCASKVRRLEVTRRTSGRGVTGDLARRKEHWRERGRGIAEGNHWGRDRQRSVGGASEVVREEEGKGGRGGERGRGGGMGEEGREGGRGGGMGGEGWWWW